MRNLIFIYAKCLIQICLLGTLVNVSLMAQAGHKEAIYQKVNVQEYIFEGSTVSKDGREPAVCDTQWIAASDKKRQQMIPFNYVFRIKKANEKGSIEVVREIWSNEVQPDFLAPLWFAGFDKDRELICLWNYGGSDRFNGKMFDLYYWSLKYSTRLERSAFVSTFHDPDSEIQLIGCNYQPPRSILSPSGKYLAVLIWGDENYDPAELPIQNHILVIKLLGESVSLEELEKAEARSQFTGKQGKIIRFQWLPGDVIKCVFSEAPTAQEVRIARGYEPVSPVNKKKEKTPFEIKSLVAVDPLFKRFRPESNPVPQRHRTPLRLSVNPWGSRQHPHQRWEICQRHQYSEGKQGGTDHQHRSPSGCG